MTPEKFEIILQNRLKSIQEVLGSKSKEYAQEGDRLFNFKLAAQINGVTPAGALWGMATKHLVSVMDLVEDRLEATPYMINEKIGDMVSYLILLEAILLEDE